MTTLPRPVTRVETDWACFYCGHLHLAGCEHYTVDHVVPKSRGGRLLGRENLVDACRRCNTKKGARTFPDEWVPDVEDNTIVLPGLWSWPRTPRSAGLLALGLRELLEAVNSPLSVREIAAMTGDELRLIRQALDRLRHAGVLDFAATQERPWRRYYTPAR